MSLRIEPLTRRHARAAFTCGVESLDVYIRRHAGQDSRRDVAVCHVLCDADDPTILGYYTLSAVSVQAAELPAEIARRLPRYPMLPAVLLGRLAVDDRFKGQGFGELLVLDALKRVLSVTRDVAAIGVLVDAENEAVVSFYERYDFQRLGAGSVCLFLPLATIRALFPETLAPGLAT